MWWCGKKTNWRKSTVAWQKGSKYCSCVVEVRNPGNPWRQGDAEMGGSHHPELVYSLHVLAKSVEEANRTLIFAVPPTQGHFSMMRLFQLPEKCEIIELCGEEEDKSVYILDEPEHVRSTLSFLFPSEDPFRSATRHSIEPPRKTLRAETAAPVEDVAQAMVKAFQLVAEKMSASTTPKAKPEYKIDDRTTWIDYTSPLTAAAQKELLAFLKKAFCPQRCSKAALKPS